MAKPKIKLNRPNRDPDHYSKRDVPYWWSPEWIRGTTADNRDHDYLKERMENENPHYGDILTNNDGSYIAPCDTYGRIHAVKTKGDVELHMKSKDGNLTYIKGSIQREFKRWHEDRQIDYILLGIDPDEILASDD